MKRIVFIVLAVAMMSCSGFPIPGSMSDKEKQELLDRASRGDSVAQYQIFDNTGFANEARILNFQKSLESGYPRAIEYKIGKAKEAKNWKEYVKWYQYGVEKGSVNHIRRLAIEHLIGKHVKKDTLRAMELFQMAIEKYDAESRWRLRELKGEEVPALIDFFEEMRDRWHTKQGSFLSKFIRTWTGARGAILRTGFGFDSSGLNIAAWLLTPLVFIVLFVLCFHFYQRWESRFVGLMINPSAASLYCAFLGVYGALFWRSEGISSLGSLSVTGSGFLSLLTLFLSIIFWLLLIYGIVIIFITSPGIPVAMLRLILLPVFCVFGFLAANAALIIAVGILALYIYLSILYGDNGGNTKKIAHYSDGSSEEIEEERGLLGGRHYKGKDTGNEFMEFR